MRRHLNPRVLAPMLVVMALMGCAEDTKPDPTISSETHWLQACQDEGACGPDADCVCGLCTVTCDEDVTVCSGLDEAPHCVDASHAASTALCEGYRDATQNTSVCLPDCSADADCTTRGMHLLCVDGHCTTNTMHRACDMATPCPSNAECFENLCYCPHIPMCEAHQQLLCEPTPMDPLGCLHCACIEP